MRLMGRTIQVVEKKQRIGGTMQGGKMTGGKMEKVVVIVKTVQANYSKILDHLSNFPLSFCHGDVKSES